MEEKKLTKFPHPKQQPREIKSGGTLKLNKFPELKHLTFFLFGSVSNEHCIFLFYSPELSQDKVQQTRHVWEFEKAFK